MKRARLIAFLLSAAMCASGCGSDGSSSEDDTSVKDTSAVTTADTASESEAVTTISAESQDPSAPDEITPEGEKSSLYTIAVNDFSAQDISGGDVEAKAEELYDKAGSEDKSVCYTANIGTLDLFDPFDDLTAGIDQAATFCSKCDIFALTRPIEIKLGAEGSGAEVDGIVMALCFRCDDTDKADTLFDLIYSQDIKGELEKEKQKGNKAEIHDDFGIASINENEYVGIYKVGREILFVGCYDDTDDFIYEPLRGDYKKMIDYIPELEKLCSKLGVKSPSELSKT